MADISFLKNKIWFSLILCCTFLFKKIPYGLNSYFNILSNIKLYNGVVDNIYADNYEYFFVETLTKTLIDMHKTGELYDKRF